MTERSRSYRNFVARGFAILCLSVTTAFANLILTGTQEALVGASTRKARLYTASPNAGGGGTEVSGGSYVFQLASYNTASGAASTLNGALNYGTATASWGTIVAIGLHETSGNVVREYGAVTTNRTVGSGTTVTIADTAISVSYA